MPGIVPKNISTRQSGAITGGTMRVGNSKGMGSANRMVSHCKSSGTSSDCVATVLNAVKPNPPKTEESFNPDANMLFDISTFSRRFDLDGSGNFYDGDELGPDYLGHRKIDEKYITALTNAANRWNTYIRYTPQMNSLIYNRVKKEINGKIWKGLELYTCRYKDAGTDTLASAAAYTFNGTSMNFMFILTINNIAIQNYNMNTLTDLFTHELGHVLGMPCWTVLDGTGEEVLPLSEFDNNLNTKCYIGNLTGITPVPGEFIKFPVFPNAIKAFNKYGAFKVISKVKLLSANNIIPLHNKHSNPISNYKHWSDEAIIDSTSSQDYHFIYCGLPNEILNPYVSEFVRSIISLITIKLLTDIYTLSGETKVYNYTEINPDASEVIGKPQIDTDNYTVTFIGNPQSYTKTISSNEIDINNSNLNSKSIKNNNRICLNCDCEPIFI
jgi:hypothetical protein